MTTVEIIEKPKELCWSCSKLMTVKGSWAEPTTGGFFMCRTEDVMINPGEFAIGECDKYDNKRSQVRGKVIDTWRLLVAIDRPVAVHSLDKSMIGALGTLKNLRLVVYSEGEITGTERLGKHGQNGVATRKLKMPFVEAI